MDEIEEEVLWIDEWLKSHGWHILLCGWPVPLKLKLGRRERGCIALPVGASVRLNCASRLVETLMDSVEMRAQSGRQQRRTPSPWENGGSSNLGWRFARFQLPTEARHSLLSHCHIFHPFLSLAQCLFHASQSLWCIWNLLLCYVWVMDGLPVWKDQGLDDSHGWLSFSHSDVCVKAGMIYRSSFSSTL